MLEKALQYLRTTGPVTLSTFDDAFHPDGFDLRIQMVANSSAVQVDDTIRLTEPSFALDADDGTPACVTAVANTIAGAFRDALAALGFGYTPGESTATIAKGINHELKIAEMREFILSVAQQTLPGEMPSWARDGADFEAAYGKVVKLARELKEVLPP